MVRSSDWTHVETPVSNSLHDVTTTAGGAFAVGDSGTVIRRQHDTWTTLVDAGPTGNSNDLRTVAASANGRRVWFAGASGVLGCFDLETNDLHDFSNPAGKGDTWQDLRAVGRRGTERVYAADDNGEVAVLSVEDATADDPTLVKPLSAGDAITGFARDATDTFYAANANGKLLTATAVDDWDGTHVVDTGLVDVEATKRGVYLAAGSGFGFRYAPSLQDRAKFDPDVSTIHDVAAAGDRASLAGTNGVVADESSDEWVVHDTPASTDLYALAHGSPDVVVGSGGVVLERTPDDAQSA